MSPAQLALERAKLLAEILRKLFPVKKENNG